MPDPWDRIEAWLAGHLAGGSTGLAPGADAPQIAVVEAALGVRFPADFHAAYLRHNGQDDGVVYAIYDHWEWYPLRIVVSQWRAEMELYDDGAFTDADAVVRTVGPVQKVWWHPQWIPFAGNSSGDYICLDLAPADGGTIGQIIEFWHADEHRRVVAPSFTTLLDLLAGHMEAGDIGLNVNGDPVCMPED